MNLDKIEKLVKIIENSSMLDFSIQEGDVKIKMSRRGSVGAPAAPMSVSTQGVDTVESIDSEDESYITSPIVGTFYAAPSPDAKAFVKVGDRVKAGQTVCILEAMKLMNEIESDYDCEIEAVLASNEQKVEYGQPLFKDTVDEWCIPYASVRSRRWYSDRTGIFDRRTLRRYECIGKSR